MKRSFTRSPYLWTVLGAVTIVAVAWIGRERYRPVTTGSVAPAFSAYAEDGREVHLSEYAGKVVLLNIWATWCPPCLEEMPSMQRLYEEMEGEDFEILAVSVDSRIGEINMTGREGGRVWHFAEEMGLTFDVVHDPNADVQRIYQTTGVPETFLIGRDGVIYKKVAGGTQWDLPVHKELVRRLLAG